MLTTLCVAIITTASQINRVMNTMLGNLAKDSHPSN